MGRICRIYPKRRIINKMINITQKERIKLYTRLLLRIMFIAAIIFAVIVILPPFFSLFAPFIFAFILAAALNPLVSFLNRKLRAPRKILSAIIVIFVFFSLATLIVWFVYYVMSDIIALSKNIQDIFDNITASYDKMINNIKWIIGFFPGDTETMLTEGINSFFSWIQSAIKEAANHILANSISITTKVGSGIIAALIFILSAYFITADYPKIKIITEKYKGSHVHNNFKVIKDAIKTAFGGYIKAQLLLSFIAFIIMFVALSLYGQSYALLIALLLAAIDFIPLLGTSAIIVPWAFMCFIDGDIIKAVFLICLTASFFVIRKLIEPKVMSTQTGLHPLTALIGIYVGMKIAGIWGMIFCPIIIIALIGIKNAGIFNNTLKDVSDVYKDLKNVLKRK